MLSSDLKNMTATNRSSYKNDYEDDNGSFTLLLNNYTRKDKIAKHSVINASKPFFNYLSCFGIKLLGYSKNNIHELKAVNKIYSTFVILLLVLAIYFVNPRSWQYTKTDTPLYILTLTFGVLHIYESLYLIFNSAFGNSKYNTDMMKCLDDIDKHFGITKNLFLKNRIISLLLIIVPLLHLACMMSLLRFYLRNLLSYFTVYLVMLQGILIIFIIMHIYTRQLMLNDLLINVTNLSPPCMFIYKRNMFNKLLRKILTDTDVLERKLQTRYCWLELMQIYDKLSDAVQLFNNIYASQVFIMFSTWLLGSLLVLCRTLSPSVKYVDVIVSDLFLYATLNSRPLVLSKMCQLLMTERRKTLSLLFHNIVYEPDNAYAHQIKTMIMLVETRTLVVSANVFTADIATVLDFAGRVISYAVLMIQYFYIHVFLE